MGLCSRPDVILLGQISVLFVMSNKVRQVDQAIVKTALARLTLGACQPYALLGPAVMLSNIHGKRALLSCLL